ncbi:MAG: caspase domain-containing protein [Reyranella sp.]
MLRQVYNPLDFCTRLEQAGSGAVAFFYYAGHGIQHDGTNYLLPVKAEIPSSRHLPAGALRIDEIVAELARMPRKANVIVLDACRNNPLPNMAVSSRNVTQGLAALKLPAEGMLVVYSTAAGEVAEDGDSDRSPYATALVEVLPGLLERGRRIHDVFVEAADRVRRATGGKQKPALYMHGSLPALEEPEARVGDIAASEREVPASAPTSRRQRWRRPLAWTVGVVAALMALGWATLALESRPFSAARQLIREMTETRWERFRSMLGEEFPASITPSGYRFAHLGGFCCVTSNDEGYGIEARGRDFFIRDDLPKPASKEPFNSFEGYNYIFFTDAGHAARFKLADIKSADLLKVMLGTEEEATQRFNERAWRGAMSVTVTSSPEGSRELPCYVADTLIGCLARSPNPRVLYHLMLQEPALRTARTDEARQKLVQARVQKEAGLLMHAAEEHVRWAERMAGL